MKKILLYISISILILVMVGCEQTNSDLSITPMEVSYEFTHSGLMDGEKEHLIHEPFIAEGKTYDLSKEDVDLKESPNDDGAIIQAIIDKANPGDDLYFPTGIYNLHAPLILKSQVNLRGEAGTVFVMHSNNGVYPDETLKLKGLNNLVIEKIKFSSDYDGEYPTDTKSNNDILGGPKYVIRIEDDDKKNPSYNITIRQVHIENYVRMGVRIATSHDVVVEDSTFEKATDIGGGGAGYGVSIQGEGNEINSLGLSNDTYYNVIRNCDFIGPYLRHGVLIQYYAHNNLITNNTLNGTMLDAIDLHGEDEYLNEISYNTIENILTGAGIGVGNSGASHDKSGPHNHIHHNTIINTREGIKVHLGSPNTLIENNMITGMSVPKSIGIYLQNAPGTVIRNNAISDSDGVSFWGMVINADQGYEGRESGHAMDVIIEDNSFEDIPAGLKISAGENIVSSNNIYRNIEFVKVLDTRAYEYKTDLIPSQVFSLLNWKINLPIENAKEIRQPHLKTFEHEKFFYVNETNDGIVFNAPCQADETDATTANSKYPRSELREMAFGGMAEANWSTDNGKHTMIIDQMITQTPEVKSHVVVGQIHDADDDVIMIRLEDERLFVEADGDDIGTLDAKYVLGTRFTVKITVENDIIKVNYNGDTMVTYEVHKEGCYFKAGMYTQSNTSKGDAPDAYGEVVIYDLSVSHEGVQSTITQTYDNPPIPTTEASSTLQPVFDTYIDLMKVDGIITQNVSPRNTDDKLMVKTSTGQTTIRLSFVEFNLSELESKPTAANLHFTGKDINGTSEIMVFGFEKSFGEALVWGDLFTDESRISKNNSDVMDYLDKYGKLTAEATIGYKDPTKEPTMKDKYGVNVSDFIDGITSSTITFVLVEPIGVDVNMQLFSYDDNPDLGPRLDVWTGHGSYTYEEKEETDEEVEEKIVEEEINMNAVDINEALDILTYALLLDEGLPSIIGNDVQIEWLVDGKVIDNSNFIIQDEKDKTLMAKLSKGNDTIIKEFILIRLD